MNGPQFAVFVGIIVAAFYFIPRAVRYDRVMAELEGLDDESLAAAAADAWNRGEWS